MTGDDWLRYRERKTIAKAQQRDSVYVITRKARSAKITHPVCYQNTRSDAELFVKLLREDPGNKNVTFGIRTIKKGKIHVEL